MVSTRNNGAARFGAGRVGALLSLAAAPSSCRADPIPIVACAVDSDCGVGSACVELSCQPAAIVVSGRDGGRDALPPTTLLDDFEQPNGLPDDARFGGWTAALYDSDDCKEGRVGSVMARSAAGRLVFEWSVTDLHDGTDCFPAVGVTTTPVQATIDLTVHDRMRFALTHRAVDPACVAAAQVSVALLCDPVLYSYIFPTPSDWQTHTVPWDNFVEPEWVEDDSVSLRECLSRVQNITFSPVPNLRDGQCQAGALQIDAVWLGARRTE